MKKDKHTYGNFTQTSTRDEDPGSGKRCGYFLLSSLCGLLCLSLMTNIFLTYFYLKLRWASDDLLKQNSSVVVTSLERVRRCSAEERQIQYKDRLYVFPTDEMSWISSRENCQELGGDLVIINSNEEHMFLVGAVNTFSNSLHWIGLRTAENKGKWLWVDETPLVRNLSWWKHMSEDSESEREDCVGYYDGQWVDLSCLTAERRICEITCTP